MAHVAKYPVSAIGHICNHHSRSEDLERCAYVIRGNESIDPSRTYLNYNLAPTRGDLVGFIRQRCSEVRCMKRKDVNVLCSWVLTVPKDFMQEHPDRLSEFFQQSYVFLEQRYGRENVVSAYVHMDETTPHMHFAFVPVTRDKKRNGFKVSAREVLTRQELSRFHHDLSDHLQASLGLEVHVLNDATKNGNKEVAELKKATAHRKVLEAEEKAVAAQRALEEKLVALDGLQRALDALRALQLSIQEIQAIQPQKGFTGALKGITVDDVENLKATAIQGLQAREKLAKLSDEYKRVKEMVPTMQEQMEQAQELQRLREIAQAFYKLPSDIQQQLLRPDQRQLHEKQIER